MYQMTIIHLFSKYFYRCMLNISYNYFQFRMENFYYNVTCSHVCACFCVEHGASFVP